LRDSESNRRNTRNREDGVVPASRETTFALLGVPAVADLGCGPESFERVAFGGVGADASRQLGIHGIAQMFIQFREKPPPPPGGSSQARVHLIE